MYNTCNVNYTQNGCYNTANTTSGCFGCGQRVCRDCCGNIWVRRNTCGCHCQTTCQNGNTTSTSTGCCNAVQYGFFTVYGRGFQNTANQTGVTTGFGGYYARQYGLYPYGGTTGCCGGNTYAND